MDNDLDASKGRLLIFANLSVCLALAMILALQWCFYGSIPESEIEEIWAKLVVKTSETLLATALLKETLDEYFMLTFVGLLAGNVWAWMGQGRVKWAEQRLSAWSLRGRYVTAMSLSLAYNMVMFINTLQASRHNRRSMPLLAFEFATLTLLTMSSMAHYGLCLMESYIVQRGVDKSHEHGGDATWQEADRRSAESVSGARDAKVKVTFFVDLAIDTIALLLSFIYIFFWSTTYASAVHIIRNVFTTTLKFCNAWVLCSIRNKSQK